MIISHYNIIKVSLDLLDLLLHNIIEVVESQLLEFCACFSSKPNKVTS